MSAIAVYLHCIIMSGVLPCVVLTQSKSPQLVFWCCVYTWVRDFHSSKRFIVHSFDEDCFCLSIKRFIYWFRVRLTIIIQKLELIENRMITIRTNRLKFSYVWLQPKKIFQYVVVKINCMREKEKNTSRLMILKIPLSVELLFIELTANGLLHFI